MSTEGEPRMGRGGWTGLLLLVGLVLVAGELVAGESAENFHYAAGVRSVLVSPDGEWVAAIGERGKRSGILAQHWGRSQVEPVLAIEGAVRAIWWVGRDQLLALVADEAGRHAYVWIRLSADGGRIQGRTSKRALPGGLIDPLPLVDGEVIWAFNHYGKASLQRTPLEELMAFGTERTTRGVAVLPGRELASRRGEAYGWIVDGAGRPRAVWMRKDEQYRIYAGTGGRIDSFPIREFDAKKEGEVIQPAGLDERGEKLLVLAHAGEDTIGLHELDPDTGEFGRVVFRRPDVDLVDIRYDVDTRAVIGVEYDLAGRRHVELFDDFSRRVAEELHAKPGRERAELLGLSADGNRFAFRLASETEPGAYYVGDRRQDGVFAMAREANEVDRSQLSASEVFTVESTDGIRIEAYLTRPRSSPGDGGAPLVVHPHGGPFELRDDRGYDAFVQYLASWGYAVLEVNFRGSGGFGREFVRAGKRELARGIEDDIEVAVAHATSLSEIDGGRVCIVGASYGGFSALASLIRFPGRYQCAVSIMGVSDLPLISDSSDTADSKRALEIDAEWIGDPETERDRLIESSPAYHADRIQQPVFLIHGTKDRRVDVDHAHRMALMLDLYGAEWEELLIEGMEHGYRRNEAVIVARSVRRFLTRHLMSDQPYLPDPPVRADAERDPISTIRIGP
ncbi:MAG TPA: prolyl oligopeptidase family serine peptidase [Myxococcota bacterium]|nr:prolyl oligopeptidase family serine peptidase [Myxococcota bacterium]